MGKIIRAVLPSSGATELGGNGGCGGMVSLLLVTAIVYGAVHWLA